MKRFIFCFSLAGFFIFAGAVLGDDQDVALFSSPGKNLFENFADNSLFIEEAYNQEKGVVQHIFTARFAKDDEGFDRQRFWELEFSQEWPVFSQDHQIAYNIPYGFLHSMGEDEEEKIRGIGDMGVQYRYQLLHEGRFVPAFAPAFGLILPTGDEDKGFGTGTVGYEFVLPFSKVLTHRLQAHLNAGLTYVPGSRVLLSDFNRSPEFDLIHYQLGGSLILAVTNNLHILLESLWETNQNLEEIEDDQGEGTLRVHRFHQHEVVIAPGVRVAWNLPKDIQVVTAAGMPIGLTNNATDIGAFLYLSIEHPFLN